MRGIDTDQRCPEEEGKRCPIRGRIRFGRLRRQSLSTLGSVCMAFLCPSSDGFAPPLLGSRSEPMAWPVEVDQAAEEGYSSLELQQSSDNNSNYANESCCAGGVVDSGHFDADANLGPNGSDSLRQACLVQHCRHVAGSSTNEGQRWPMVMMMVVVATELTGAAGRVVITAEAKHELGADVRAACASETGPKCQDGWSCFIKSHLSSLLQPQPLPPPPPLLPPHTDTIPQPSPLVSKSNSASFRIGYQQVRAQTPITFTCTCKLICLADCKDENAHVPSYPPTGGCMHTLDTTTPAEARDREKERKKSCTSCTRVCPVSQFVSLLSPIWGDGVCWDKDDILLSHFSLFITLPSSLAGLTLIQSAMRPAPRKTPPTLRQNPLFHLHPFACSLSHSPLPKPCCHLAHRLGMWPGLVAGPWILWYKTPSLHLTPSRLLVHVHVNVHVPTDACRQRQTLMPVRTGDHVTRATGKVCGCLSV
ncbi:unnamed protein product [Protopolystoma xenopodis]|uniref:Uncharacterized protein n=1 Tax=Protopolystoma xenopodis TaxID=117903 RepID=A0A3S5FD70_9PLAT|nr:unnamed protein product [Protopolystoma xenopodis]